MAGGSGQKSNQKQKHFAKSVSSSEVLNNFQPSDVQSTNSESGILTPGQSIEFNKESHQKNNWSKEFLSNTVEIDQKLIIQRQGKETQHLIEEIRLEIQKLVIELSQELGKEVTKVALTNIPENNHYQLTFLGRIKNLIQKIRQDISESNIWLNTFNQKKGRQNSFWGKARNKKSGGQKYLFSSEHSASRSAN
jgi:uncharacterized protein DUF5660